MNILLLAIQIIMAYNGTSIVDYLNSIGGNSTYASRAELASTHGITGYTGSAGQNTQLLSALRSTSQQPTAQPNASSSLPTELGAAGRGDFKPGTTEEQKTAYWDSLNTNIKYSIPLAGAQDFTVDKDPVLNDGPYKGMRVSEAKAKKEQQNAQTSANTTFQYNPETIAGASKAYTNFSTRLKEANNDTWSSIGSRQDKAKGIYESSANDIAKLFTDTKTFDSLYNTNPEFKGNIDNFVKAGGSMDAIRSKITAPVTNPNTQSTAQYLQGLKTTADPNGTQTEQDAFNSLIPERQLAQDQIQRIANIPQQYKDLYFGSPENVGIYEAKRIQAEEAKRIIDTKARNEESNLRAQAQYAVDKNNADLQIESAKVEENRLASRNYMTGMLAKLGALNTTGAAPVVLATLEQKYQQDSAKLQRDAKFYGQEVQIKLTDGVNKIQESRDEDILRVQSDLTKDKETVSKEILKLNQQADRQIYSIMDKATGELRTQTEKYTKAAQALAIKNAKAFHKTVSKGVPSGLNLTPTEKKTLDAAGLSNSPKEVRNFFLKGTEPAFRQTWTRNAQLGENKNPSVQNITNSYNEWKAANKKATGSKSTGRSVVPN